MPTAPKVIAALLFAFIAWLAAGLVIPHFHEAHPGANVGQIGLISAAAGLLSGWFMSGGRAGDGPVAGIGYGLTTVALSVFWVLFVAAGYEALQRSLATRYDGPIEAIGDMIKLMLEYGQIMLAFDVVVWLLVGAVVGGVLTEMSARKWS
jgi:hypothetical protein